MTSTLATEIALKASCFVCRVSSLSSCLEQVILIMEVASAVIGVVSLGLHLVEVVQKANGFLRGIHNAPDEISRLAEGLTQLELLLSLANTLVGQQRCVNGFPEPISLIANALYKCERSMRGLSVLVDKIQTSLQHQRWVRRTLASIKAVLEQEDIERLRKRIQEDQSYLQMAIVINMSYIQLHTVKTNINDHIKHSVSHRYPNQCSLDIAVDDGVNLQVTRPAVLGKGQSMISRERRTLGYQGIVGYVRVRTKVRVVKSVYGGGNTVLSEETSIIARPLFLKRTLELRYQRSLGTLTRTLKSYPMIPRTSEVFSMCQFGRLEDLQQVLSRGQVSPFVTDECGKMLLHYAVMSAQTEICLLLIRLGVDPGHMCIYGNKPMHFAGHPNQHDKPELKKAILEILRLVITTKDHLTVDDILRFFYVGYDGPPEGVDLVLSQGISIDETLCGYQTFCSPFHNALRLYGLGNKDWISFIRKTLRKGIDIHTPTPAEWLIHGFPGAITTLLDKLLFYTSHPSDANLVAKEWLSILEEEGYDIVAYLQEEIALHHAQQMFTTDFKHLVPRKLVIQMGDFPSVSWEWWVDPLTKCSLVRSEFKHMNHSCVDFDGGDIIGLPWKWDELWPFGYPEWTRVLEPFRKSNRLASPEEAQWHERTKLNQTRIARRAEKKRLKLARAQGIYRPYHLPGAWVE